MKAASSSGFTYNDRITGEITSTPFGQSISFTLATTRLNAIYTAIEGAGDNREVRIGEILTEYDDVDFEVATISLGGASGAAGLRFSPIEKRAHLKDLLERNLGIQIRMMDSPGGGGGRSIHLVR